MAHARSSDKNNLRGSLRFWFWCLFKGACLGVVFISIFTALNLSHRFDKSQKLIHAIELRDYTKTKQILDEGTPPDSLGQIDELPDLSYGGTPPLTFAINTEDPKMVRLLLDYGSDPVKALSRSAFTKDTTILSMLIVSLRSSQHKAIEKQETLNSWLDFAAGYHAPSSCRLLLQSGAKISYSLHTWATAGYDTSPCIDETAKCANGAEETLNVLCHYGADLTLRDSQGNTALQCAYRAGNIALVKMLHRVGAQK